MNTTGGVLFLVGLFLVGGALCWALIFTVPEAKWAFFGHRPRPRKVNVLKAEGLAAMFALLGLPFVPTAIDCMETTQGMIAVTVIIVVFSFLAHLGGFRFGRVRMLMVHSTGRKANGGSHGR